MHIIVLIKMATLEFSAGNYYCEISQKVYAQVFS